MYGKLYIGNKGYIPCLEVNKDGNPVGTVITFAGTTAPKGYLLCDGREVSRTIYSDLFSVIGTTYGPGDGSSSFNLPDVSDRVLEGNNHGYIEEGLPNITGSFELMLNGSKYINSAIPTGTNAFYRYKTGNTDWYVGSVADNQNGHYQTRFDASKSNPIYGNSTTVQPKSVLFMFYIKF